MSWREAHDKLTFIACEPLGPEGPRQGAAVSDHGAREENMRGDINFFLYPDEEDEDQHEDGDAPSAVSGGEVKSGERTQRTRWLVGEVDVMIAHEGHRGRGFGGGAVRALLVYLRRNMEGILAEYHRAAGEDRPRSSSISTGQTAPAQLGGNSSDSGGGGGGGGGGHECTTAPVRLRGLMAKIKEGNAGSRALFAGLGFVQRGEVNYFGEVTVVMGWEEAARRAAEWEAGEAYSEVHLR